MRYFAYGSNMDPDHMRIRGVMFSKREHAFLDGWRLVFNKTSCRPGEGYANIEKDIDSTVEGILYEIEDADIGKLDEYEDYPEDYDRIYLKVRLDDGAVIEAFAYIAQPDRVKDGLRPTREYLSHLLKGCDLLSEQYCLMLMSQEACD